MNKQQDTIENNPIIEVKKDWRRDNLATRIDLRMPNEVYDRVIEIAIASGEKINPKTSQVRVTATLNKLIEIGIRYYPDDNQIDPATIGQLSDSIGLEDKYQELSDKYRELESTISDINPIVLELTQDIIRLKSIDIEETIKTYLEKVKKPISLPTTTPKTAPNRTKPESEPDWVTTDNRRFYRLLVNNSELLAKVDESIELHPTDNKALAESLVNLGLHKADGTPLDSASMSRIKKVAFNLQA